VYLSHKLREVESFRDPVDMFHELPGEAGDVPGRISMNDWCRWELNVEQLDLISLDLSNNFITCPIEIRKWRPFIRFPSELFSDMAIMEQMNAALSKKPSILEDWSCLVIEVYWSVA
jgi:hypothetical protein